MKLINQREQNLTNAWNEFLRRHEWTLWLTLTFKYETSMKSAKSKFKDFFKYFNSYQDVYFDKYIHALVFFEKNAARDGVHIHTLIDRFAPFYSSVIEREWRSLGYGQQCMIKVPHEGIAEYIAKKEKYHTLDSYDYYTINAHYRGN